MQTALHFLLRVTMISEAVAMHVHVLQIKHMEEKQEDCRQEYHGDVSEYQDRISTSSATDHVIEHGYTGLN